MTNYSDQDLADEWEFKIVRANTGVFDNPAELKKLVKEEALSGWILLEKFDNSRVRFKRRADSRKRDSRLPQGVDPCRTHHGMSPVRFAILLAVAIVGASLLFTLLLVVMINFIVTGG